MNEDAIRRNLKIAYLSAVERFSRAEDRLRQRNVGGEELQRDIVENEQVRRRFQQKVREQVIRIGFQGERILNARDAIYNVIVRNPNLFRGRDNARRDELFLAEYMQLAGMGFGQASASDRIVIEPPPDDGKKWQGYTKPDIEIFNAVFDNPSDISVCPVCLSWTLREKGCMYMKHACPAERRHHGLYSRFNSRGMIEWCTLCGRISDGHRHYLARPADSDPTPGFAEFEETADPFQRFYDTNCKNSGGGGHEEKILRFDGLIRAACELQPQVGIMNARAAFEKVVEGAWNAATLPPERAAATLKQRKFDIPCELPKPAATRPDEPKVPDVRRPADEKDLAPIKHEAPDNDCAVELGPHGDGRPVYQFQHKQPDGKIWRHEGEFYCAQDLETTIRSKMMDGRCPLSTECQGRLYPEEIQGIVNDKLYETYRETFNRQNQRGGAAIGNIFQPVNLDEAQCAPPPKKAGRRKTYRKRKVRKHTAKKISKKV